MADVADAADAVPGSTAGAAAAPGHLRGARLDEGGPERLGTVASLVRLAIEDDDPQRLVTAAAAELRQPMGLVAPTGEPLGHAPDDAAGRRALAIATGIAAGSTAGVPPGWRVVRLVPAHSRRAVLALGTGPCAAPDLEPLLDLVVALLGEQLVRSALRRRQVGSFLRRLVSEPGLAAERAREEASAVGLELPAAYWPAVLSWDAGPPAADIVERVDREARRLHGGGLTAASNGRMVLLHPGDGGLSSVMSWLEHIVAEAGSAAPQSHPQIVAGEAPVALEDLGANVARLKRLSGYGPRTNPGRPVVAARQYALERLLGEALAPEEARSFVDDLLGGLIAWDREHRSDLLRVLEAALDSDRHDQAAHRCYMHRNTFRLRLRKALLVLGDDLEDPGVRLAVHVALKLRHITACTTDRPGPTTGTGSAGTGRRRRQDAAVAAAPRPARRW
jgi:hypothetical protein